MVSNKSIKVNQQAASDLQQTALNNSSGFFAKKPTITFSVRKQKSLKESER